MLLTLYISSYNTQDMMNILVKLFGEYDKNKENVNLYAEM